MRVVLPWILFWKNDRSGVVREWGWARSLRDKASRDESGAPLPWIPYAATALLAERLTPGLAVLQLGAGHSTLFFMTRVARVVTIEHDPHWLDWTRERAQGNVELITASPNPADAFCAVVAALPGRFDVIVVDSIHRNEAFAAALGKLTPRGVMLLDDSSRVAYAPAFAAASEAGLRHLHFVGHKPMSVNVHRSTLFYRDGNCLGI